MANTYYTDQGKIVFDGVTARASDLNNINTAVNTGFNAVEVAIDNLELQTPVNVELARKWAEQTVDVLVDADSYSALHHATKAAASANTATNKATDAATSEANALTYRNSAEGFKNTATTQAGLAVAAFDSFDDRYLGSKAVAPTLDNDGNALATGAMYWNSAGSKMYVYNGSLWEQTVVAAGDLALKAPINNPTFTGTVGGITKAMVGLGNVDNTTDALKPVSADQAAAIDLLKNVPANAKSSSYTLILTDRGKSIDTTANVLIPTNASVAFPIGSVITIFNNSTASITVAAVTPGTTTVRTAGTTSVATVTISNYGIATVRKVATDVWVLFGVGIA
jgi:hypothetical protein